MSEKLHHLTQFSYFSQVLLNATQHADAKEDYEGSDGSESLPLVVPGFAVVIPVTQATGCVTIVAAPL